jgi:hypothetical protein
MTQSRTMSAVESVANVAIGYGVAVATQAAVFPLFGIHASAADHFAIGAIFTLVSLARSYLLRRFFNRIRA